MDKKDCFTQIQQQIFSKLDVTKEMEDEEILSFIQEEIQQFCRTTYLSVTQRMELQKDIFNSMRKLDVLTELLEDESITEIMVNGANHIFLEKDGKIVACNKRFSSKEKLEDVIQQIVAGNNQTVNESRPIVDTRLADGSRVNIVLSPIAIDESVITIRRFPKEPITMERLLLYESLNEEMAAFLKDLVAAGYNIFISGGTGSGKTTMLNALTQFIPEDERVITIEDSAELQVLNVKNLVRLEARDANVEGDLEISIRELVRTSLRMRPDRIIVGECRGAEAIEVLQANNTGHDGSMSSGHANSTRDMITRLETMVLQGMELPVLAIRNQIASAIDIFIHLERLPNGKRKVMEIVEVLGMEDDTIKLQTLFEYQYKKDGGKVREGWIQKKELANKKKLERRRLTL